MQTITSNLRAPGIAMPLFMWTSPQHLKVKEKKMDSWVCSLKATHVWCTNVCHRQWHSTFGSHYSTVSLSIHSIIVQLDASDGPSSRDKMIVRHLATEIPASKDTRFQPTASCWSYLLFLLHWPNLGNFFSHIWLFILSLIWTWGQKKFFKRHKWMRCR